MKKTCTGLLCFVLLFALVSARSTSKKDPDKAIRGSLASEPNSGQPEFLCDWPTGACKRWVGTHYCFTSGPEVQCTSNPDCYPYKECLPEQPSKAKKPKSGQPEFLCDWPTGACKRWVGTHYCFTSGPEVQCTSNPDCYPYKECLPEQPSKAKKPKSGQPEFLCDWPTGACKRWVGTHYCFTSGPEVQCTSNPDCYPYKECLPDQPSKAKKPKSGQPEFLCDWPTGACKRWVGTHYCFTSGPEVQCTSNPDCYPYKECLPEQDSRASKF